MKARLSNWLVVKYIFTKNDWNHLFLAASSQAIASIRIRNTREKLFSHSNTMPPAEMFRQISLDGPKR